ncbi:hypothetical protein [Clostridium ganghwense]|uniref:Flagellar protein FliT n=1 Tax=Clostridium ganghwense TaxID=312089 RepID=A0ABT4CN75_9CLOT|nr:hypothetical protein [Clostridium ganghwense]MCY6370398.1 hypothetical protein [Clostridium ganghwense]
MSLRECLTKYKQITLQAMECLKRDEIEDVESLIQSRDYIIEDMKKIQYSQEDFKNICNEYGIMEKEKELFSMMNAKKIEVKRKMDESIKARNVKNQYNTVATKAVFLAREV